MVRILACNTIERTEKEFQRITTKHPASIITTTIDNDGGIGFDMTGVDVVINPKQHTLKISMEKYSDKVLERFSMEKCAGKSNPSFPEANLYNEKANPSKFEYRECVGALQWLATNTRPDLAHSVNMLARASANKVTTSMARCCRAVMQYLKETKDRAIIYSPENEMQFNNKFGELTAHDDNKKKSPDDLKAAVHTFTDASFGVTYKKMRSISGCVVFLYGTPIAWRSKVQTVFAASTTESEWIAMADGITFSSGAEELIHFLVGGPKDPNAPLWCDNRGAVLSSRYKDVSDIPKRTRHVALKHTAVLSQQDRVWFCPTGRMLADGLTKSSNSAAMRMIFDHSEFERPKTTEFNDEEFYRVTEEPALYLNNEVVDCALASFAGPVYNNNNNGKYYRNTNIIQPQTKTHSGMSITSDVWYASFSSFFLHQE